MERLFVAQKVATRLTSAETALEAAIEQAAHLLAEMHAARSELGLASTTGADETARVGRAVAALQDAHSELVGAHHGLNVLGRALNLRTRMGGWKPAQTAHADSAAAA